VLYVVILSPILLLSIALASEVGGLEMQKQRVRSAVDQSVVVAASAASRAGRIAQLDTARAAAVLRDVLIANLTPLASAFAGATPQSMARDADVAVITDTPAPDPFGRAAVIRQPSLEVRMRVPLHTGLFAVAGLPSTVTVTLVAAAALRETGT
jgi:hypothetical protein